MFMLIFPTIIFFEIFLILRRTERVMIIFLYWSSCKVPVILVRLSINFNFFEIFAKNTQISKFMQILSVGAEQFHADGRADRQTERDRET